MKKRFKPAKRPLGISPGRTSLPFVVRSVRLLLLLGFAAQAWGVEAADAPAPAGLPSAPSATAESTASEGQMNDVEAQGNGARSAPHRSPGTRGRLTPESQVQRLTASLALTADQQTKIKAMLERRQVLALQIHARTDITAMDRVREFHALDRQTVVRINSLLTSEQRAKYEPGKAVAGSAGVQRLPPQPDAR